MQDRSQFLVGQMTQWIEALTESGRVQYLFELEMWLKSFERYFRVSNQPLHQDSSRSVAIRSFYEEISLVARAVQRVTNLCTLLASEDRVDQERFDKYVENYLRNDDVTDPYIARLLRQNSPEAGLALLRESFEDLHLLLTELTKLSRVPYPTFQAIGRLIYREIRHHEYLGLLLDRTFSPSYDRITSEPITELVHRIENKQLRRIVAKIFLDFFRILHYLDFVDPRNRNAGELRMTLLIFSLISSEAKLLLDFIRRSVDAIELPPQVYETLESFVYCIPLELRKVIHTELSDISFYKQTDSVYMRMENSHGILRDCFQQSVVQLGQAIEPELEGRRVFNHFQTKLDQSLALREALVRLVEATHRFQQSPDEDMANELQREVSAFYENSIKYLMYRDWGGFELFYAEILKCESIPGLVQIAHRFDTYLMTLLREVSKRDVLQKVPSHPEA